MKRVVIVHGYTGTPQKNWFPWLKAELEKEGIAVDVPRLPHADAPVLHEWIETLTEIVGEPDENVYLVGHSLGCPTILRYLESLPEGRKVAGILLVAGFAEPLPHLPELDGFCEGVWNDEKIKKSCDNFVLIHSKDDTSVPFEYAERLQKRLNTTLITIDGAGHINEKSGYTQAPIVLDSLLKMMQ